MPRVAELKDHVDRIWCASFHTDLADTLTRQLRQQALLGVQVTLEAALREAVADYRDHLRTAARAAGRDWLGIDHDSLPDRMAFIRSTLHQKLWLPPVTRVVRPTTEPRPIPPVPATPGPVGQQATVTFGNLADIGKAFRAARKLRREELEQQAETFQPPMFDF